MNEPLLELEHVSVMRGDRVVHALPFAGIAPASVPLFVLMQVVGGALALGLILLLYPRPHDLAAELTDPRPTEEIPA